MKLIIDTVKLIDVKLIDTLRLVNCDQVKPDDIVNTEVNFEAMLKFRV